MPHPGSAALLALPGRAGAIALASLTGTLAAGDERGEAGLWDRERRRLVSWRFRTAIVGADIDADGARAAFIAADGEAKVLRPGGSEVTFRGRPGDRVHLDRAGPGAFVVSPATGQIAAIDAAGRIGKSFAAPGPIAGSAAVSRIGGLATVSRLGVVARLSAWGSLVWGGDWRRYAAGVASDPRGEVVVACFLSHGAEVLQGSSGGRLGVIDLGRAVESASVSSTRIALGCPDGTLSLLDRSGRVLAEGRAPARVHEVAVDDDGTIVARLADGSVRAFVTEEVAAAFAPEPAAPTRVAFRRDVRRTRAVPAPLHVAVSGGGAHVAYTDEDRRVIVLGADGSPVADESHEGDALALRVGDDGVAWAATTREIRRVGADGATLVRRFAVDLVRAAWADGGASVACADEMGAVRLVDVSGADVCEIQFEIGDAVDRLVVTPIGLCVETRRGRLRAAGPGWSRDLDTPTDGERVRLATATRDGPVATCGNAVVAFGWDGRVRWRLKLASAPATVAALHDGTLAVVLARTLVVVARDGAATGERRRPEGELAAVAPDAPTILVWRDGRRVTVAGLDGARVVEETLEAKVLAAAASRGGLVAAALVEGRLVALRAAAGSPERAGAADHRVASPL